MSKETVNYKVISIVLAIVLVAGAIFVGVTRLAPEPEEEPAAEIPEPVEPKPDPTPAPVQVSPAVEGELARIIPGVPRAAGKKKSVHLSISCYAKLIYNFDVTLLCEDLDMKNETINVISKQ